MCGVREYIYGKISVPSFQRCCEPRIFLKNKVYLKENDDNDDDNETICFILKYMWNCTKQKLHLGEKKKTHQFPNPQNLDICNLLFESSSTQKNFFPIL